MKWEGVHVLVQAAKAGDTAAVGKLYQMVQPYLLRQAKKLLGPAWTHQSVSDLTQGTWVRVLKGISSFDGGGDDANTGALLRAWLLKTMKHVRCNDIRFETCQKRAAPPGNGRGGQYLRQILPTRTVRRHAGKWVPRAGESQSSSPLVDRPQGSI